MLSLLAKMKILVILEENSWKMEIKLFPLCAISLELVSDILRVIVYSRYPVKLICCNAFVSASSACCLLKSIAIISDVFFFEIIVI